VSGKQNLVVFLGVALIIWNVVMGWQRDALFHGSWV
jgi:hypothetical protein